MPTLSQVRSAFLDYFKNHEHHEIPSSPLVPQTDASLMFTNSGMVQFKNIFTGREQASVPRAVTSQKCLRAGGKHNDLENVGHTARHHTFFEMLGNFSFGDYFKEQAIVLAWEFLTKDLGLSKDRLIATVYHDDDESAGLWKNVAGLGSDRIIRISTSDNFWQMGDTGPCGPCSEIFYDHGPSVAGGLPGTPDEDGDRFVEIWNLVFMQYLKEAGGVRTNLPRPSIDTGMGLERITAVLQGKHDNYDIDIMQTIISEVQDLTGQGSGDRLTGVSHKVIADHMRSICFLLAEGVMPSNEGRGYVLRRIMRRAMRHAYLLGMREPVLHRLVHSVTNSMDDHYGELQRAEDAIRETLYFEEQRFGDTLQRGLHTLDGACAKLKSKGVLPAGIAFRLYDTYGFPLDLTEDILRDRNFLLDRVGVDALMKIQKDQARKSWKGSGDKESDAIWFEIRDQNGSTEFLGYEQSTLTANILALVDIKHGQIIEEAIEGQTIGVVCNQTPFYAEGGGQRGDRGWLRSRKGKGDVICTERYVEGLIVHTVLITNGVIRSGDNVALEISDELRRAVSRHHTLTHLLHAALRDRLGKHVAQGGSSVVEGGLRFDFSHPRAIEQNDLDAIEDTINNWIWSNLPVESRIMGREQAIKSGAMALFGERYGDEVRVIRIGREKVTPISMELCGGTHVHYTGEIGSATIIAENAVAAGVRRIEMTAGDAHLKTVRDQKRVLRQAQSVMRCSSDDLISRIQNLLNDRSSLLHETQVLRRKLAACDTKGSDKAAGSADDGQLTIGSIKTIFRRLNGFPARELKSLADSLRSRVGSGVVVLGTEENGKATLIVSVTADWQKKGLDARKIIQDAAVTLGARAGGREGLAQTGGRDAVLLGKALDDIRAAIEVFGRSLQE